MKENRLHVEAEAIIDYYCQFNDIRSLFMFVKDTTVNYTNILLLICYGLWIIIEFKPSVMKMIEGYRTNFRQQ